MKKPIFTALIIVLVLHWAACAQTADDIAGLKQLYVYEDSLKSLGFKFINDNNELIRKNANYAFIKTLVSALKIHGSFRYPFDSVKTISILNAPDNRFRVFTWQVMNNDGSFRFYGAIQMNTGGNLKLYPLEDYSPLFKNPEDSVTDNRKWFGAQYYKMIEVHTPNPYYVVLGWKGNTIKSTKKVIDVISFKNGELQLGLPVFTGNGKTRKRVVFEYTRQASMLLKIIPEQALIVFDHLMPPEPKYKGQYDTYGPDLSYSGYKLTDGVWKYVDLLDLRNIPDPRDELYIDPRGNGKTVAPLTVKPKSN